MEWKQRRQRRGDLLILGDVSALTGRHSGAAPRPGVSLPTRTLPIPDNRGTTLLFRQKKVRELAAEEQRQRVLRALVSQCMRGSRVCLPSLESRAPPAFHVCSHV